MILESIVSDINFAYFLLLFIFFILMFYLIKATNFEKIFKQGKTIEIKIGYFILSLILAHILTTIFLNFFNL